MLKTIMSGRFHDEAVPTATCLARSVIEALAEEPLLEAVTIDRTHRTISLATLGRADVNRIEARLTSQFQEIQSNPDRHACHLLTSGDNCLNCAKPLSDEERKGINIQHTGCCTTIARVTCPTSPKFWRWRNVPFPKVVQRDVEFLGHAEEDVDEWKPQLALAVLCGVFGLTGYFLGRADLQAWSLAGFIAAYLAGAWFQVGEVWERLREGAIDVHFLMLAVAAGAASIGAWGEGTTLLFLFSLSGALEHFAMGRTQKEIRSLFHDAPKTAIVLDAHGNETEVKVEQLRPGMKLLVKPGAQFPVDAEIIKGATAADESNLTGEATPVEKKIGDTALAGTLNLWGAVELTVLRPATESALQKIIHLIKSAQQQKAPAQRFADRFGAYYTYCVLVLSAVMFFIWWLAFELPPFTSTDELRSAFYRAMTLLVVASPCALVLSIPSAILAAIAWGARHGVLIRGGAAVEKLADVDVVALDKTGTLTTGELRVEKIESFPPGREFEVARFSYSLERLSTHPLARAITKHGKQQGLIPIEFDEFESVSGMGLRARFNGSEIRLGRRNWISESNSPARMDENQSHGSNEAGSSEVWLASDGLLGRIVLRDDLRPQARVVVDELKREGLRTLVLTGDRKSAADHLRTALHVDEVRAELKPEEKIAAITELNATGHRVAMIGDGVNDAPSLAAAHVGIAMGARGSDAALEQADVVLMHDRLENFLSAFRLSQRARRIIRQNLVVSLGTVVVLVTFALLGQIPLPVGVVGHEGSTVIVVMNSLRLLFGSKFQPNSENVSSS